MLVSLRAAECVCTVSMRPVSHAGPGFCLDVCAVSLNLSRL